MSKYIEYKGCKIPTLKRTEALEEIYASWGTGVTGHGCDVLDADEFKRSVDCDGLDGLGCSGCILYGDKHNIFLEYMENNGKQTNNIKGEDKMGKTVIGKDIKAEFGKENGDTLINVNDHFNEDVMYRIFMKKYHKEIVTECNEIEAKRLEAEKD